MNRVKMAVEERPRSTLSRRVTSSSIPQLPPLSINSMTTVQLQEFVPALMKVVMGRGDIERSPGRVHRPPWWPKDVPLYSGIADRSRQENFAEAMKKVIRNCYHSLGQEELLSSGHINEWKSMISREGVYKLSFSPRSSNLVSYQKSPDANRLSEKAFLEIYICFFCAKEFSDKDEMRLHQSSCGRPEQYQVMDTPPQKGLKKLKRLPSPLNVASHSGLNLEDFLKKLNLVPMPIAKKLRAEARKVQDFDYAQIDVNEPEHPISPTTPKTPKSLISQLSRDESSLCKRRLSYRRPENRSDQSDTESEVSGSSEEPDDMQPHVRTKSLLNIEVSSVLGQRIQKHIKSESNVCVVSNAEDFCKTPVKNQFLEKLRKKEHMYPITYKSRKPTKRRPHFHMYCFTKRERREHLKVISTGLNKKSRELAKSLPTCKVVMGRLKESTLRYLQKKANRDQIKTHCVFPRGPTFLSEDIDRILGLRKKIKPPKPERTLSLTNVISEDTNAEVLQQKVALYRSLLSDLSSSKKETLISMSPEKRRPGLCIEDCETSDGLFNNVGKGVSVSYPYLNTLLMGPVSSGPLTPTSSTSSSPEVSQKPSNQSLSQPLKIEIPLTKPKTDTPLSTNSSHNGSRDHCSPDDCVSIITVSSDDESFNNAAACCAGCRERMKCKCSPEQRVQRRRNVFGQFCNSDSQLENLAKVHSKVPSSGSQGSLKGGKKSEQEVKLLGRAVELRKKCSSGTDIKGMKNMGKKSSNVVSEKGRNPLGIKSKNSRQNLPGDKVKKIVLSKSSSKRKASDKSDTVLAKRQKTDQSEQINKKLVKISTSRNIVDQGHLKKELSDIENRMQLSVTRVKVDEKISDLKQQHRTLSDSGSKGKRVARQVSRKVQKKYKTKNVSSVNVNKKLNKKSKEGPLPRLSKARSEVEKPQSSVKKSLQRQVSAQADASKSHCRLPKVAKKKARKETKDTVKQNISVKKLQLPPPPLVSSFKKATKDCLVVCLTREPPHIGSPSPEKCVKKLASSKSAPSDKSSKQTVKRTTSSSSAIATSSPKKSKSEPVLRKQTSLTK